ncbi:MAG: GAF domain-containing protein [bacterium]|nr:GAF domain-containing protein [bacterium]
MQNFSHLVDKITVIVDNNLERDGKLKDICKLLKDNIPHYNWVGFYIAENSKPELILGPYIGAPTEHTKIPFGKGICGQAAERKETFVVQDVSKETNYLSCSINVKSEIVVPIFKDNKIVGELDIDSHTTSSFTKEDKDFLENICKIISKVF